MTFVWCPPGEQTIAVNTRQEETEPLAQGFWIGTFEAPLSE